ncbi:glycosyl hydrolase family 65 protein [Erythrobacter sp.]|uniref:glycoside hydrolase family 65 protein n=1 Tax=Erythrobacter sp. TaxID=1042 RepID=UPI001425BE3B|nr:glycosyl hydrolase family 65 protein [Erythrobacter sp.]QIQ88312.1 MAG: glycoside hydrolase family 65 protein [Erythrobacter sp.]
MLRARRDPPRDVFPPDPWGLAAVHFDTDWLLGYVGQAETMFALSNGYLGIRGTMEEGHPVEEPGTYLNGFYESRPITYGESAYGFPDSGQSILVCPDGVSIELVVDDEPFDLVRAEVLDFSRRLDFAKGVLTREVAWRTARGRKLTLRTTRLVSLAMKHVAAISWELVAEDDADIIVTSRLVERPPLPSEARDPRIAEPPGESVLEPTGARAEGARAMLGYVTRRSRLALGCGMDHVIDTSSPHDLSATASDEEAAVTIRLSAQSGVPMRFTKFLAYHHGHEGAQDMLEAVGGSLDEAIVRGFDNLLCRQTEIMGEFWDRADVEIEGDPATQQVIRWNIFQLLQSAARVHGHGIGARGLTGRSYEGHYFWDTEIYVLPFLTYTAPDIARALLKFRYDMLPQARLRAAELGHRGATFPWRTINGHEASAYYAAGTAQYHINADIAYALDKYVAITGDTEFMARYGAEILIETARFWLDLGFFSSRRDGRFCINGVTGPDEYNALVDNNYFTNLMAQHNLRLAARTLATLDPEAKAQVAAATNLGPAEPDGWLEAAERMYLPQDERLGVHPQDDSFLDKEVWDFARTPEENYPLLLHYHPLNLYRAQVVKQADTLLAMFLMNGHFSAAEKKRNFDYYDPITTHDSSLSVCIQSIIASEIGYADKAIDYFDFAATMDLSDIGGNVRHGAHVASIGGTWMALVYGFAGLRDGDGTIAFSPRLPDRWSRLCFALTIRGRRLRIAIDRARTVYRLERGDPIEIVHEGEALRLSPEEPEMTRSNRKCPPPPRPGPGAVDPAMPEGEG